MKKITDARIGAMLFGLCWIAYFTSYIGRLNYSSAISTMKESGVVLLSQAGTISMAYFFAYACGQLVNGSLADRVKPQWMIFWGLMLSGVANMLMGLVPVYPWLLLFWGANGYLQAMIWPPIIRIIAERFDEEKRKKYAVDFATSMVLGTLASYLLSAGALKVWSWQSVFYIPAALLAIAAVVWMIGYRGVVRTVDDAEDAASVRRDEKPAKAAGGFGGMLRFITGSGLMVILLPVIIHGVIKDGITQWVPTYLYEQFDVTASFSVILTMVLPLINLAGAYMARWADHKYPQHEVGASCIFFALALAAIGLLLPLGKYSALLTAMLFAVATSSIMAVNTLFINLLPLHFEKQGKVATVSGFMNAVAYMGSAISTYVISLLAERMGWSFTVCTWVLMLAVGLIWVIWMRKRDFSEQKDTKAP